LAQNTAAITRAARLKLHKTTIDTIIVRRNMLMPCVG
jgi:hypothetical protein